MKNILFLIGILTIGNAFAQSYTYPVIKSYGGIYDVPDAIEKPDPTQEYKIVIDLAGGSDRPGDLNFGLNNIARMINLHAIGGVPKDNIHVIVAVHNEATYTILDNSQYRERYKMDNPNLALYKELKEAGVQFYVCGQSLVARKIDRNRISEDVGIATSMLTVLTTYQLKGYASFKF
jgi:intracellular sulfur oxidation DsrE/DsrF family protein